MDSKNNNKEPIYRKCPRCKSIIKANLWECPICKEGLNPNEYKRKYKMKVLKVEDPERYHKIQQKIANNSNDTDDEDGCGKGCSGCMAVIATIIAFMIIMFLLNNSWIIVLGFIICVAASVGYAAYQWLIH